jgi:tungstate transport system substrate-binding protein
MIAALLAPGLTAGQALERFIVVASTTTTQDSGLLSVLGPRFSAKTGIGVRFAIFGTGQALDVARRGDVDAVLSHDRAAEERFVAEGHGVRRHPVMYNDFVLIGPRADPVGAAGEKDIAGAFQRIRAKEALFVSRGDRSGTHVMELALWRRAGIDIAAARGRWYREIGQGQGAALNIASSLDGYLLADRGTWLNFRNRGTLAVLSRAEAPRNQYGAIVVDPRRHPAAKSAEAQAFVDWLTGPDGQAAIRSFRIDGQPVFFPNATEPDA